MSDNKSDEKKRKETIINQFRTYFMNYRAPTYDLDTSSSSVELDASFQRLLDRNKQMTNKENSRPPNANVDLPAATVEKETGRDMPLGEVFLDHQGEPIRNIPNWILEDESLFTAKENNTSYTSELTNRNRGEYSEINRLLADCDINHENTTFNEKSGLKQSITKNDMNESTRSISMDSLEIKNGATSNDIQDDTLEEIEYVLDRGLLYVPVKNIKRSDERKECMSPSDTQRDTDVILIDSSPENSFNTAKNNYDGKSMMTTDSSYVTAKDATSTTRNMSYVTDSDKKSSMEFFTINSSNESAESRSSKKLSSSENTPNKSTNNISNRSGSLGEMPEFNNTLETVEYMIERGRAEKLMAKSTSTLKAPRTPSSPLPTNLTPQSSQKKSTPVQKKATPQFKKPESRPSPSPLRSKNPVPPLSSGSKIVSKIPIPGSSSKIQFKHIASPVASYINNTPEIPLIKTVRPMSKYFNPNIYGKAFKGHDMSVQSTSKETAPANTKAPLPRKVFKSASQQQITDHRQIVTPGGKTVQQLIGNAPLIIRHQGRINQEPMVHPSLINDSVSDSSVIAGDISIQAVFDVHRDRI